jgi:hypothetical protein
MVIHGIAESAHPLFWPGSHQGCVARLILELLKVFETSMTILGLAR